MRSWEEVHRLHDQEHLSGRAIAKRLRMSRNTVRRLLELPEPPRYSRSSTSLLDPFRESIAALLEQDPTMPATVIRRRLVDLGYVGGLTILREYLATVRPHFVGSASPVRSAPQPVPIDEADTRPSGTLKTDWNTPPGSEPGMNLISTAFEIIMINRTNERLFKKPITEMLGKKCYQEFERRLEVCPHCPGAAALATGHPHRVETRGIRDDGTKYRVRLTAYPILGPGGTPAGFVEVEEDITEQKRTEDFAGLFHDLHSSLAATRDIRSAVRQALNLAFTLEGVDFGCAYLKTSRDGEYQTIAQRGTSRGLIDALLQGSVDRNAPAKSAGASAEAGSDAIARDSPGAVVLVPVSVDDRIIARLLLGSSTYAEFPAATTAALESLGRVAGSAIASFKAMQLEREVHENVRALMNELPLPVWSTDEADRVVFWNPAAERLLGWRMSDVMGSPLPLCPEVPKTLEDASAPPTGRQDDRAIRRLACFAKGGDIVDMSATLVPGGAILGRRSGSLTVVHEWSTREIARSPRRSSVSAAHTSEPPAPSRLVPGRHVLIVDHDDRERKNLKTAFNRSGLAVSTCRTAEEGIRRYGFSLREGRAFAFVVAPLLVPAGQGGLALASTLLKMDPRVKVVLSTDAPIIGLESHGLAGFVSRPCTLAEVTGLLETSLLDPDPTHRAVAVRADARV